MSKQLLDGLMVAAVVIGIALMIVATFTDLSLMVGIGVCGLASALLVVRQGATGDDPAGPNDDD